MTGSISEQPVHPLGPRARVLLASAFGPYAQDDLYGSSSKRTSSATVGDHTTQSAVG